MSAARLPASMGGAAQLKMLGVGQRGDVLRLPCGFVAVGSWWFQGRALRRVVVSSSVRRLGSCAFQDCAELHEVIFEPGSTLTDIGESCFERTALEKFVVPQSVRTIGSYAFRGCLRLCSVSAEDGSVLQSVGFWAFQGTELKREDVSLPNLSENAF